jgi:glycosyltransferase involved in cell wall biosynthesis
MTRKPLRILYAAGPGDVIGTYRHWKEGRDDPSEVAITYSGQFFDVCRELGAEAWVISYNPRRETVRDGGFVVEHRPVRFMKGPGPLYILGQVWYGLRLVASALRFRADVVVAMSGMAWFTLALLPMLGVRVVPTLHSTLWRVTRPPRGFNKVVWALNRRFFRRRVAAVMCVSDAVAAQLLGLVGRLDVPVERFVPTYRPELFQGVADAPPGEAPPFRVFYAGRIERNKGVFDLLAVAERFKAEGRDGFEFDLCGSGGALEELRRRVADAGLEAAFRCHGHVQKQAMREMYRRAHVVVVPTTTEFVEGLNKVVVEAVLAARPVITSPVCPALEYVRGAVVEVPPDDVDAYARAILKLAEDHSLYEQKRRACAESSPQFYDRAHGWGETFKRILVNVGVAG